MEDFLKTIEYLVRFFFNGLGSLIVLIIMSCIVLYFVDERRIICIIKRVKPSVVSSILAPVNQFINDILNLFINKNSIEINKVGRFNNKVIFYLEENNKIEKNIFVLSLSEGIVKTLNFIGDDHLYETAINYLVNYLNELQPLKQDRNFYCNIMEEYNKLNKGYSGVISLEEHEESCDSTNIISYMKKTTYQSYFEYLVNEKDKLIQLKNDNNNKIVDLIQKELHEREIN